MLIIGAKGFASEILEDVYNTNKFDNIAFFDDINLNDPQMLFNRFRIIKTIEESSYFLKCNNYIFTIGIGRPKLRFKMYQKFTEIGGVLQGTTSPKASIGTFDVAIGVGTNILSNAIISNTVKIGMGCIIYYNVILTHNCIIGHFVELSPNAILLGDVTIGDFTHVGSNATILPNIKVGENVVIGAGSVVTKNIPDNCIVAGVPAVIIRNIDPLNIKIE